MIENKAIFEAIQRGYSQFENANQEEILHYFKEQEQESLGGHVNNIKGILFEQEYLNKMEDQGVDAYLFEHTNHPNSDMLIDNQEFQLKATDNVCYINETLESNPDIPIIATTEVANLINNDMVIDSGISNTVLEESVSEVLFGTSVGIPFGIGLFFGLPF